MNITSSQNEKIKKVVKLKNKNKREKLSLFLIEGYREIFRALSSKIEFESLFVCDDFFLGSNEEKLIEKLKRKNIPIYNCKKDVFKKISYRDRPDGLLAIAKPFKHTFKDLEKVLSHKKKAFLVIVEAIEKPGNLGTILRSSDAAGVDAVLVADPKTDIFNPNVVRASIGTLFSQMIIVEETDKIFKFLKEKKIQIVATTPHAKKIYTKIDLTKSVAIAMGTEQYGLSDTWMKKADIKVKIPMLGIADSLNVASATTILLYETQRQRNFS